MSARAEAGGAVPWISDSPYGERATASVDDATRVDVLSRATTAVDEEERELWKQLRRKGDFEGRVAEKRAQLEELRDQRRGLRVALAEASSSVDQLSKEVNFARAQEREIDHDIAILRESNRIVQTSLQPHAPLGSPFPSKPEQNASNAISAAQERREAVDLQHEQIASLRTQLERLRAEKIGLLQRQQTLFDKQRSAEQDRNRLIGVLQDDRNGVCELRQHRITLLEDRATMEREMAQVMREVQDWSGIGLQPGAEPRARSPHTPRSPRATSPAPVLGVVGGVRSHVPRDTPLAFANTSFGAPLSLASGNSQPLGAAQHAASAAVPPVSPRQHWIGFS